MIEQRDQLLVQGDDMTVGQMKSARRMTEQIQEQARKLREHFTSEEYSKKFVEYLGREKFNQMQQIINDAERGKITFSQKVTEQEQKRVKNGEPSIIDVIYGK